MTGSRWIGVLGLALAVNGWGCAHLVETKAIEKFSTQLKNQDLEGLKTSTSEDFAGRALRTAEAMEDLQILHIPEGKTSIVDVEKLSEHHRRVTVAVGEAKKEVFYELTQTSKGNWVVDDIYLKQSKRGVEAYKAVSEQMDLLISIREFLNAWDSGDRSEVLNGTTPEFRAALEKIPPAYLAQLTEKITRGRKNSKSQRPQAQITDDIAVVKIPQSPGELILTMEMRDDQWCVSDVILRSKNEEDEKLPSLYREAIAIDQARSFLAAYERSDRPNLKEMCTEEFYDGSLSIGNLKEVPLPSSLLIDHDLSVSLNGLRADLSLRNDREVVQLTMHRRQEEDLDEVPKYRVSNASIYDIATQQEMRIGALFTARAMGEFYLQALSERDMAKLRYSSTSDFTNRVWKHVNEQTLTTLPLEPFDGHPGQITKIHFDGSLAQVDAQAGGQHVQLDLREESGRFLVDDIHWEIPGRPSTAKATLELILPVRKFAYGMSLGRDPNEQADALALLQETSSRDFNRMVWTQAEFVPASNIPAESLLNAPLNALTMTDGQIIVHLGDNRHGAVVTMLKEHDHYAIDEVQLIEGPLPADRIALKQEYRTQLSRGLAQRPGGILHASDSRKTSEAASQIVHAKYEEDPVQPTGQASVPREFNEPEDAQPIENWEDFGEVQTEPPVE